MMHCCCLKGSLTLGTGDPFFCTCLPFRITATSDAYNLVLIYMRIIINTERETDELCFGKSASVEDSKAPYAEANPAGI